MEKSGNYSSFSPPFHSRALVQSFLLISVMKSLMNLVLFFIISLNKLLRLFSNQTGMWFKSFELSPVFNWTSLKKSFLCSYTSRDFSLVALIFQSEADSCRFVCDSKGNDCIFVVGFIRVAPVFPCLLKVVASCAGYLLPSGGS